MKCIRKELTTKARLQKVLLERPDETFGTAIAFGRRTEGGRTLDVEKAQLALKSIGHVLRPVIMPKAQAVRDDLDEAAEMLPHALVHWRLRGIYCLGGGTRGLAQALEEGEVAGCKVFVGHELTEYTCKFLVCGVMHAVIKQYAARRGTAGRSVRDEALAPAPQLPMHAISLENISDVECMFDNTGGNS